MNRREFLKTTGAAGIGLAASAYGLKAPAPPRKRPNKQIFMGGYKAPALDRVRVGFIGVGERGTGHVIQMMMMDGVEVKAICDTHTPSAQRSVANVVKKGRPEPTLYGSNPDDYKRMLDRNDIDIVIISTPWQDHERMAVDTMKSGKHAFLEVPAAITVDGCWNLVDTSEKTQKHCMMMENVCYGREELMVLNMCRKGAFGELLHGEAAYIHDLRFQMHQLTTGCGSWRTYHYTKRNGNLYPTHGLGPIAQYMNINRGDRFDYMTSMGSPSLSRALYAKEHFPEGSERRSLKFICNDINTSIVKTVLGRTIMVQWDEQLPRPYNRLNFIQGTRGCWGGFPDRCVIEGKTPSADEWAEGDGLDMLYNEYEHPMWTKIGEEAKKAGGHGGMDFVMLWRMVYCLRNGLALDQDVYDAAAWSVISPLSEWSVARRGQSVDIPDFTRGNWKTATPLAIVS